MLPFSILLQTATNNSWSFIVLPLAIVCWLRRKSPLGGWLLWFVAQMIISAAAILVIAALSYRNYFAAAWHDPKLHLAYALSRPPEYLVIVLAAWTAYGAALHLTRAALQRHLAALSAGAAVIGIVCLVDLAWFPSLTRQDARIAGYMLVVILYLKSSARVKLVFAWEEDAKTEAPVSPLNDRPS